MTPDQAMSRAEREAIMIVCGNVPPEEAQRFCDRHPEIFGIRDREEQQDSLL